MTTPDDDQQQPCLDSWDGPCAGLTDEQLAILVAPLHAGRVRQHKGNDHVEAWDVRRWLLRIFGWGGWTVESTETLVSERSAWDTPDAVKGGRHSVVYRVHARLTIRDSRGERVAYFEDAAVGGSSNQTSLSDAHDQALKTAHSQALKRCAVNLGDAFGLSLYGSTDDRQNLVSVVGSFAHKAIPLQPNPRARAERVESGELQEPPAEPPPAASSSRARDRANGDAAHDSALAQRYVDRLRATQTQADLIVLRRDAETDGLLQAQVQVGTGRKDGSTEPLSLVEALGRWELYLAERIRAGQQQRAEQDPPS